MILSDVVTEDEYSDVLEGVKDLLKETYKLTDIEAIAVIGKGRDKAEEFLYDYFPYVDSIKDIQSCLRETLDDQFQRVDQEIELDLKMSSEAAVWLTFECVRKLCEKSLSKIY